MRRTTHLERIAWLLLACTPSPACTRGKAKDVAAPSEPAPAPAAELKPLVTDLSVKDWKAGDLPGSVLEGTPVPGGELILAISTDPPGLNELAEIDGFGAMLTRHRVYEGLVRLDLSHLPQFEYVPELAERWEISDDQKTYTFHLRQNVRWHDGKPFSAKDVVATFDKIRDPASKAVVFRTRYADLVSYSAPDDFTFVTVWKRPSAFALDALNATPIEPAHIIAKLSGRDFNEATKNPLNRAPLGTGPFKFDRWDSNVKLTFVRNPDYWGQKPLLDRLTVRLMVDGALGLQLAERGDIDWLPQLNGQQWRETEDSPLQKDWHRVRYKFNGHMFIGWNNERPLFADKRVRRAMTMLVDRPGIIDKILLGLPQATECTFFSETDLCDPALEPLPYDPAAAGRLLDELGWKDSDGDGVRDKQGKPFRFTMMLTAQSEDSSSRWVSKIKEDMARAGVVMELQRIDWTVFMKNLNTRTFDASVLGWGGANPFEDPSPIWRSTATKGGWNYVGFKNAEVDQLLDRAREELDPKARSALYRRLGEILHDQQPYTVLYTSNGIDLIHKRIKGVRPSLSWWNFESIWLDPALRRKSSAAVSGP